MEKLVFKVLIMIAILVIAVSTVAQAATFVASMTPSSSSVAPATEVIVVVKISNLDVGQNGINALSGIIQYDTGIFETINSSSIEGINDWKPNYSSENGKITLTKTQFVKSDEEVFQITLKTKAADQIKKKATEGVVTFRSIVASNSEQDITSSDISTTIKIATTEEQNTVNNTTANNTTLNAVKNNVVNNTISLQNKVNNTVNNVASNAVPIGTNNKVNNTTNNAVSTYNNTVNSVNDDMPYTGVEDTIVYVMLAVIAIALVFYFKFEKINRDIR